MILKTRGSLMEERSEASVRIRPWGTPRVV